MNIIIGIFSVLMLVLSTFIATASSVPKHLSVVDFSTPFPQDAIAKGDSITVDSLNMLAEKYAKQNDAVKDTVFLYAKRAFELAEHLGYKRGMAEALAVTAYRLNFEGKIEQGLEAAFKQLRLAEELGDKRLIARGLINIGFAAGQQSHADSASIREARVRLLKALDITVEIHDDFLTAFCYNSLGRLARLVGQQQVAQGYHEKALVIAQKIANTEQIAWALHSLALIDESYQRYALALQRAEQSLALREQSGRVFAAATSLRLVGSIHFKLGNFVAAKQFAERSIAASKGLEGLFLVKVQAYQLLSDAYLALNKPSKALRAFKTYTSIKDSAAAIESKNNILQLQAQVDRERREREQSLLARDRDLQEAIIQRQYAIGLFSVGCVLLLSIVVGVLWRTNRQKKKQNDELSSAYQEISQQQEILESQAQEIEITNTQLQETNETLGASNRALDEANTFKLNMLSIAAHDLKNPLHTIANFAELIQENSLSETAKVNQFAERINRICDRMLTLIHDLLETAAHDLGKMNLHIDSVNLSDLVLAVVEQYTSQAQDKQQVMILENYDECWVEGDSERIYQVIDNLLSNAVKYSPLGKRIWLKVESVPHQALVRLSVKDEGPGMTPSDQEKAFVMFQRLSAETTGGEGSTGVGLALVKQIVELHGGTISIISEAGSGAEFVVEFPCPTI